MTLVTSLGLLGSLDVGLFGLDLVFGKGLVFDLGVKFIINSNIEKMV